MPRSLALALTRPTRRPPTSTPSLLHHAQALRKYGWRKKSREEREAELAGRLDTPALKALFEERLRAAAHGRDPPSAAELAQRYGARQEVLEKVLQHASVPLISEAEDGRLVGSWPHKR